MPDSLIAVPEGEYRFDVGSLTHAFHSRWLGTTFSVPSGRIAILPAGQFSIEDDVGIPLALVDVDIEGQSLDLEWTSLEILAELVSVITAVPGFPDDGTVLLSDWATDLVSLRARMSSDEVSALRVG